MESRLRDDDMEGEGNEVAGSCQERDAALRCWRRVVDTCGIQEKVLADAAGMKVPHFSKVSSGQQGDFLGMIFRIGRTYPALRRAFIAGLAENEGADPLVQAAEHLALAAMRFMRLKSETFPLRMAHAELSDERKRGVA